MVRERRERAAGGAACSAPLVIAWKELLQLRRDRLTLGDDGRRCRSCSSCSSATRSTPTSATSRRSSTTRTTAPRRAISCARLEATGFYDIVGAGARLRRDRARAALGRGARRRSSSRRATARDLARGATAHVQLVVDGSDPQTVGERDQHRGVARRRALGASCSVERLARVGARRRAAADRARARHLVQPRPAHGGLHRARPRRRHPDDDDGDAHGDGHRARARARHARAADRLARAPRRARSSARSCPTSPSATCR